jgi:uncharacterized protein YraI
MKRLFKLALLAAAALAPLSALAADGYVNGYVNLRAGPDVRYPRVTTLPPGTPIAVFGCTNGWSWCDVQGDGARGWISANYVSYPYDNQRVMLSTYGGRIGIPIVNFVLDAYWGNHYRNRSWYPQRTQWARPGYRPQQGHYQPYPGQRPGGPWHGPGGPGHGPGGPWHGPGGPGHGPGGPGQGPGGPGHGPGGPGQGPGGPGHGPGGPGQGPGGPGHGHKPPPNGGGGGGGGGI